MWCTSSSQFLMGIHCCWEPWWHASSPHPLSGTDVKILSAQVKRVQATTILSTRANMYQNPSILTPTWDSGLQPHSTLWQAKIHWWFCKHMPMQPLEFPPMFSPRFPFIHVCKSPFLVLIYRSLRPWSGSKSPVLLWQMTSIPQWCCRGSCYSIEQTWKAQKNY